MVSTLMCESLRRLQNMNKFTWLVLPKILHKEKQQQLQKCIEGHKMKNQRKKLFAFGKVKVQLLLLLDSQDNKNSPIIITIMNTIYYLSFCFVWRTFKV